VGGEHLDWIGGEWRAAAGELFFERALRRGESPVPERWPRSGSGDVHAALDACAHAAPRWSSRTRGERLALLVAATEALERDLEAVPRIASALGLRDDELAPRHADELYRTREALELLADGPHAEGVGFFQAHWSDLAAGLLTRLAPKLAAGQTAIVLGDPHLPCAAELVARAFEAAGLPRGVMALLHDDTDATLHAAATSAGLAWLRLKAHDQRLDTLRARWRGRDVSHWTCWPVRARSRVVAGDADASLEAELVIEQSLARSTTLSAQFPGQTARVLCHQRLFSKLGEELLARLESSPDARAPLPAIEADLDAYVGDAWELGLDEGATPLAGWGGDGSAHGSGAWPCLFTNVEPRSRLAALTRPAPVLRLIRVPSDEVGRELARELDEPRPS
jgi:aldehyde dehydrogenase (NAD+)